MEHFYFDHNATTPVAPEVLAAFAPCVAEVYGNASSIHHHGQLAKQRLESARRDVAAYLGCDPREVVFTSGGTESNNLAILGPLRPCEGKHVITTAIEHPAVLEACVQVEREGGIVTRIPVDASGVVDPAAVRAALCPSTALITVMHVNNELGTVQPIHDIAAIARAAAVVFHSDGVQHRGPVAGPADLYAISGHKLGAPKGIGALRVRKGLPIRSITHGGKHERERRPGTENVPGAVALGAACAWWTANAARENARTSALRDRLEAGILAAVPSARVNGDPARRAPNTTNLRFDWIEGEAMVIALDLASFSVSSGSACSSGSVAPSHVLLAIGCSPEDARSAVRFSIGRTNDAAQVDALIAAVTECAARLRRVSSATPVGAR